MTKGYEVRFDADGEARVLGPEGWDKDLAEVAEDVLFGLSKSSREGKYSLALERFLNHEVAKGEPLDAMLEESKEAARERCTSFLRSMGCKVGSARGRRDNAQMVIKSGPTADVEIAIVVMGAVYRKLRSIGLYLDDNPCKVNGWDEAAAIRIAEGRTGQNARGHMNGESGNFFLLEERQNYPPLPHDPVEVGRRVIAAVREDQADGRHWPPGAVLLVHALVDGGARFEDTHCLTLADWAVGSRFGRGIIAPDKGTNGLRDKTIVIGEELRQALADSFSERNRLDPAVPSPTAMEEMLEQARLDELRVHFLFPNARGRLFKYWNFNNDWFRKCMERHGVTVASTIGERRVTPHWLRRAKVTAEVANVFRFATSAQEILEALKQLKIDFGWRSDVLERYAANFFLTLRLEKRIATMDAINASHEVRPRLTQVVREGTNSALLTPAVAALHGRLPR